MTTEAPIIAPPTIAGRIGKAPTRAAWPVWIGVVSLTLALMSAFMAGSMAMTMAMGTFSRISVPQGAVNPFEGMVRYATPMAITCAFTILLAIAAIIAGIGLMLRKRWAVTLTMWWAVLKLLCALAISITFGLVQRAQIEAGIAAGAASRPGTPGPPPGFVSAIGGGVAIVMGGFLFVWLILLPVFMLVWFTRRGVKDEVAIWRSVPVS
jgi:hypothetical protein